jgi:hypothetical protein
MANVSVNSKADISGAAVASGDVLYIKDSNDVYDLINTKLFVGGTGVVKVKADLWAVRNNSLSLDYSPNAGHDTTKAYRKGAVVSYANSLFVANDFIPPGTALTFGTTGATWKAAAGSSELFSADLTASPRPRYGPTSFVSTHANFKAPQKNRSSFL